MATPRTRSRRGAELLGLVSFALALMLLIALATFSPHDPAPFFKAGGESSARNFIGPFGAFLAELLIRQLFGMAAHFLPLVLGLLGWKLFWCKPIDAPYTKAVGIGMLLLSLTGLFSLSFGTVDIDGEPVRAGGALGELLAAMLVADFSRTGAYIVTATTLFIALILSTQFSFSTVLQAVGGRTFERLRNLRTAWAHYRETRRKDRMRREVIRKHTQPKEDEEPGMGLPRIRRVKANEPPSPELSTGASAPDLDLVDLPLNVVRPAPTQRPLPFAAADPAPLNGDQAEAAPGKATTGRRRRRQAEAAPAVRGDEVLPPVTLLD